MKKLKVVIGARLHPNLFHVLASVGFWNTEGPKCWEQNKLGVLGSKTTQELARKQTVEEYMLFYMLGDIKTFAASKKNPQVYWVDGYTFGEGENHIWIANENGEHVITIEI